MRTTRRALTPWLLLALLPLWAAPAMPAGEDPPPFTEVFMPMRDGVKLAANVFFPRGNGPWPVILMRTPYIKDNENWRGESKRYTDAGYVYIVQDSRGKGHSEGYYAAFADDIPDGYDTVEWIAAQRWCDGNVGITGGSAMGIAANMAAIANPPHLRAAYVVVAPQSRFETNFIGGVFKEQDIAGWLKGQGADDTVAALKKRVVRDVFWDRVDADVNLDYIRIPMFNVGGWYDIFSRGNLANFSYLQNQGASGARDNQKLYMGPFGHGPLSGDLEYPGADSLRLSGEDEIRWFDYWLKRIDNGIMDEPPVTIFMMAAARKGDFSPNNRLVYLANWPPASREKRYYLGAGGALSQDHPPVSRSSTSYEFDPANPVPTVGGANLTIARGPMDQREIGERDDYLRFETEPLKRETVIAGQVIVELWASTDGLDTDFMAKLVDVYPDGYEALVLDSPIRTRYRHGRMADQVLMMEPGRPEKMVIDLWSTALTFERGHKIALHITSSNSPRFEVNPNTGEMPGESTIKPRVATNTIHHDGNHQSALVLPVVYP